MRRRPVQAPFQSQSLSLSGKFWNKPEEAEHYDNNWNRQALAQVTPSEVAVTVPRNWLSLCCPPGIGGHCAPELATSPELATPPVAKKAMCDDGPIRLQHWPDSDYFDNEDPFDFDQ